MLVHRLLMLVPKVTIQGTHAVTEKRAVNRKTTPRTMMDQVAVGIVYTATVAMTWGQGAAVILEANTTPVHLARVHHIQVTAVQALTPATVAVTAMSDHDSASNDGHSRQWQ